MYLVWLCSFGLDGADGSQSAPYVYAFVLWRLRMNCGVRAEHVAQGGVVS